jgi:catechol 2,3-dioxygenase-like lactoylglutathione lyase family enzyme
MAHPFVHVELMSTDVGKSKSFYGKLFDWTLEDMDMGDMTYTLVKPGEGPGLGFDVGERERARYRKRFPDDPAMTDLGCWHTFESENPDTFIGMYQFWVQSGHSQRPQG